MKGVEAKGLLLQVKSFGFLLLIIFDKVISCTKKLSDLLQNQQCNLAKVADLVSATIQTLEEFRSDTSWNCLFRYAQHVAETNEIPATFDRQKCRRRLPLRFGESIVLESVGSRVTMSTSDECKTDIYFPILDSFLMELGRQFTSQSMEIMKSIQACSPQSNNFLDPNSIAALTNNYNLDHLSVLMEAKLAKCTLAAKMDDIETISDVIVQLFPLQDAYPTLFKLLQISLTVSVTSAQCERCFSSFKRIKSYLRSTMTEQRLVDLASLSFEDDISSKLCIDGVIDTFAHADANRHITLVYLFFFYTTFNDICVFLLN